MIDDFRTLEDGVGIDCDICVVGAGAAGIAIARHFIGAETRVCLLESGGLEPDEETQDLCRGETTGLPYPGLDEGRLRCLGGTTHHWTNQCAPLTAQDFTARAWVPMSGWPIDEAELGPYYRRAQELCRLGPYVYDDGLCGSLGIAPPALDPERARLRFWQWDDRPGPLDFGKLWRAELAAAKNVTVLLHASAVDIGTDGSAGLVEGIDVRSLDGTAGRVAASAYVLACGGIENPRLLLVSDRVERRGLGNRHDLVGRYFMEHLRSRSTEVEARDPYRLLDLFGERRKGGVRYRPAFCTAEAAQAREGALSCGGYLDYEPAPEAGAAALQRIYEALKARRLPPRAGRELWRVLADPLDVAANIWRRAVLGRVPISRPARLHLVADAEQAANPDNRVTLAEARDALGLRRARLAWRPGEQDGRTIRLLGEQLDAEFRRLGWGRVRPAPGTDGPPAAWADGIEVVHHHMGTTRMAASPGQGVVDRDCRVHGIANLYVAGSSVFPTAGYANPTLTIVALALRLAQHLEARLKAGAGRAPALRGTSAGR